MDQRVALRPFGRAARRLVAVAALCLAASAGARADEVKLAKVPAAVRAAADKAVPKAKWTSASKETEDKKEFWYELEGTDAKGRYVHVTLSTEGKVDEVSTEVAYKDAPKAVTAALTAKFPRFKAETTYEIKDAAGKVVRYDFEGKRPKDKEEITISVTPDGKSVEVDE